MTNEFTPSLILVHHTNEFVVSSLVLVHSKSSEITWRIGTPFVVVLVMFHES
jgi:hypothetical protein